jgi:histidinol dehydrogenase
MAYGTETIAPVDKITGPGNAYVAAAKRRVFGKVGIDMIAGPSEILVIADADNDPDWIAVDLLSQAEHDESAQSILITDDAAFGQAVASRRWTSACGRWNGAPSRARPGAITAR